MLTVASPTESAIPGRVVFLTHTVFHYRKRFHEIVRDSLARSGVNYTVISGQPDRHERSKADTARLSFGKTIHNIYIYLSKSRDPAIFQPVWKDVITSDLVVIVQENRLLLNYLLQIWPRRRRRIALFGHGRNFQSRSPAGAAERWKRFWATRCDWWFAYTDETRRHLELLGFPPDRITVFNNAIDTADLGAVAERTTAARLEERRGELGLTGRNVGVFVGGLYPDKRPDFLVAAADRVRVAVPDFELIVIGGGVSRPSLDAAASTRPWLKVAGPRFGADKVELMLLAKLFLMPGLLGLAVLDAGALGLPVITTAYPWHSPEIAYLEEGVSGVITRPYDDPHIYADAVIDLFESPDRLARMAQAAREISRRYTIEEMALRFVNGVTAALRSAKP